MDVNKWELFSDYINLEFECSDISAFMQIIEDIYNGITDTIDIYLERYDCSDICFMRHYGHGDVLCVSLCSASIISNNVKVLTTILEKYPDMANSGDHCYHVLSLAIVLFICTPVSLPERQADNGKIMHRTAKFLYFTEQPRS